MTFGVDIRFLFLITIALLESDVVLSVKWRQARDVFLSNMESLSEKMKREPHRLITTRDLFGMKEHEDVKLTDSAQSVQGTDIKKYMETYRGLPVFDATLTVETDAVTDLYTGQVTGKLVQNLDKDIESTKPNVTEDEAVKLAVMYGNFTTEGVHIESEKPLLEIYVKGHKGFLVYRVRYFAVADEESYRFCMMIDAMTGELLEKWDALETNRDAYKIKLNKLGTDRRLRRMKRNALENNLDVDEIKRNELGNNEDVDEMKRNKLGNNEDADKMKRNELGNNEDVDEMKRNELGNNEDVDEMKRNELGNNEDVDKMQRNEVGNNEDMDKMKRNELGNNEDVDEMKRNELGNNEDMDKMKRNELGNNVDVDEMKRNELGNNEDMDKMKRNEVDNNLDAYEMKLKALQNNVDSDMYKVKLNVLDNNLDVDEMKRNVVDNNLDVVETKLNEVDDKQDKNETKLNEVDDKQDKNETKLNEVDDKQDKNETKLNEVDDKQDKNETKLNEVDDKQDKNETKLNEVDDKQDKNETKLNEVDDKQDKNETKLNEVDDKQDKNETKLNEVDDKQDKNETKLNENKNEMDKIEGSGGNALIGKHIYGVDRPYLNVEKSGEDCYFLNDIVKVINVKGQRYLPIDKQKTYHANCKNGSRDEINNSYSPINDALFYGGVAYRMYIEWGNVSPKKELPLVFHIHYGRNIANAFYIGDKFVFGDGNNKYMSFVSLDIVAHEISHCFTDENSGLLYKAEMGAINEAFSDLAGEAVENFEFYEKDWKIGEDISPTPLRKLCNQSADGHSIIHASKYHSDLNVHYSSGVFNRFFCLLSNSEGWNVRKIFHTAVHANRFYWHPTTNFVEGACGVIKAAYDLGYNTKPVKHSFEKVGINTCDISTYIRGIHKNSTVEKLKSVEGEEIVFKLHIKKTLWKKVDVVTYSGEGGVDLYVCYKRVNCKEHLTKWRSNKPGTDQRVSIIKPKPYNYFIVLKPQIESCFSNVTLEITFKKKE